MTRFYDTARLFVAAGNGGDGSRHLRREAYVPRGGPDGGDGGRGGDVVVVASPGDSSLIRFHFEQRFKAGHATPGGRNNRHGKDGQDLRIQVPVGTIVLRDDTGELIGDLAHAGDEVKVAKGGRGGPGNVHFKSSVRQTPLIALKGDQGESLWLRLELKLVADVGLIGCPNAGKSSLLTRISAAHPKVAPYPFTTRRPVLGTVALGDESLVVADIPGLIEGSHAGAGLGHEFLRHVERTRFLVHLVDCSGESGEPAALFDQIMAELTSYSPSLVGRPFIAVANKLDLPSARENWPGFRAWLAKRGVKALPISAVTGEGLEDLVRAIFVGAAAAPTPQLAVPDAEVVLRPGGSHSPMEVTRMDATTFALHGEAVERLAARIDFEVLDAVAWFQQRLARLGATRALEEAGIKAGDTVIIGEREFEWV